MQKTASITDASSDVVMALAPYGCETALAALRQVLAGNLYVPASLGDNQGDPHPAPPAALTALLHSGLTARQLEVARLLAQGCANKAIAGMLVMSESTVKVHIAAIFRVFGVTNRTEAVLEIQRLMQKP